jgi:hypothetical protein
LLLDLFEHVEKQIQALQWNILGWWKAQSVDDGALMVPKGHVVNMVPVESSQPLVQYIVNNEQ